MGLGGRPLNIWEDLLVAREPTLGLLHIHGFLDVIASLPDVIIPQINICHNHNTSVIVPLVVSQGMIPMKKPEFFVEEILNFLKRNQTKV